MNLLNERKVLNQERHRFEMTKYKAHGYPKTSLASYYLQFANLQLTVKKRTPAGTRNRTPVERRRSRGWVDRL